MNRKVIMIGGGGHAKALVDILHKQYIDIFAISSPKIDKDSPLLSSIENVLVDDDIYKFNPDEIYLVNGIGSIPGNALRAQVFDKFKNAGYEFMTVISDSSVVGHNCKIEMGVQIMHGAIVNIDSVIGENTLINSGGIVEHDCKIGKHNHIAPGAVLCGASSTGEKVHIGAGASVIQSIEIGKNVVIGAGAVVTSNVASNSVCYPARISIKKLASENE
jgi:sugar O-acyltransferase (sialic acid O-acetyltransferase NeuD family)